LVVSVPLTKKHYREFDEFLGKNWKRLTRDCGLGNRAPHDRVPYVIALDRRGRRRVRR